MSADTPAASVTSATVLTSLTLTDAAGRYRLENLPPGSYYITAGLVELPTFYPGAPGITGATAVAVKAGATTEGVDFPLVRTIGVRVSGRLPKAPEALSATPVRVMLFSPTAPGGTLETTVAADGTFEFPRVAPGGYTTRTMPNIGLGPLNVRVGDRDINGVQLPFIDARLASGGVNVSGGFAGGAPPPRPPLPPGVVAAGLPAPSVILRGGSLSIEASIGPDGTFEARNVPPGTYTLQASPVTGPNQGVTIVVGEKGLTGVQIPQSMAATSFVAGTISVDDGSALPVTSQGLRIQAQRANGTMTSPAQSATFQLRLEEGEHRISVSGLPLGYVVKSITYGDIDLTTTALKMAGPPTAQIAVVLGKQPMESIKGVRVAGKLAPAENLPLGLVITLTGGASTWLLEASVAADGSFEFPKTPPGTYRPMVRGSAGGGPITSPAGIQPIIVGDQDILGLTIAASFRAAASGNVRFVDRNGQELSVFPANLSVSYSYTSGNARGSGSGSIRPDGTFQLTVPEGTVQMSAGPFPEGYRLKSMRWGDIDLTREPLKATGAPVTGIEVVIEAETAVP